MEKTKRIDLRAGQADEEALRKASSKLGTSKVSETIFSSVRAAAERTEFFADRESIRAVSESINAGFFHIQQFADEFTRITGSILTMPDMEQIFLTAGKLGSEGTIQAAIREMVKNKLYDQLVRNHPDMTISFDNVPSPDLTHLFELADLVDNVPTIKQRSLGIYWRAYAIDETGKMIINQDELDRILDTYRYYAETPGELKKLAVVNNLCEAMNAILKDPEVVPQAVFSLVYFDPETKRYAPSGSYIKFNHGPQPTFVKYSK